MVVDTQGDSFFVSFATANDAVAAAVDAQRDLTAHSWPEGAQVRVRMGLHTGEPKVGADRYVGIGVHRAARIGAAGHGGQVLLSSTTRELAEEDLPPKVTVRDLGERRLKDIEQPQHLYQLVIEGLDNDFGQLRTLDVELARRRRRMYAGAALIGMLAAAVAIPVFALGQGGSGGGMTVQGNAVAEIDPSTNRVVGQVPNVGVRPSSIAYGSGSLWVANLDDQTVARIDPATHSVLRTIAVQDPPTGLATSSGGVWTVGTDPTRPSVAVSHIDARYNTIDSQTHIGSVVPGGPGSVATRGGRVWVAPSSGLLSQLSPGGARVVRQIDPNASPGAVVVGADAVWLSDSSANAVTRVDPTGLLTPITVGQGPSGIAIGQGAVWVADTLGDAVTRIDPSSRAVTSTIPVGRAPTGIAVGAGSVWVANSGDGSVTRIDPTTGKSKTIAIGGSPQAVVFANDHVWVTVQTALPELHGGAPGGAIHLTAQSDVDSMDPALAYSDIAWRLLYATCAKLLNYPDSPAPVATQLVPEAAEALPARSADGRTYTFTIRRGFRFSPPSNELVTAQTFKYTIERSLSPRMNSPALGVGNGYLSNIAGAEAFLAGKASHISGVVARGNRLTIHLVAPAPDFSTVISLPFFCAVPIGTPLDPSGVRLVPSAGPYYVSSYIPGQGVVLKRNSNYHGNRPHRLDRIDLAVGVAKETGIRQVEAGTSDYALDGTAPAMDSKIAAQYGPGSEAAKNNRQQYFINATSWLDYLALNTHRPLFHDVRMRKAVNYALDRRSLARLGDFANPFPDKPTDQYLPPTIAGFTDARVYPMTPDLAAARRMAGNTKRRAVLYTCNLSPCDQQAQIITANLAAIGIDVHVESFTTVELFTRLSRKNEPFDLATTGWVADYADPSQFLNLLLLSGAISTFDDPMYRRKLTAAARLSGPARYLAYGKLDVDLARNAAPLAAIGNASVRDFFSARVGCQIFNPVYGMDLAALCIRKHPRS
jgi:YVTN family beta-propeller protein